MLTATWRSKVYVGTRGILVYQDKYKKEP